MPYAVLLCISYVNNRRERTMSKLTDRIDEAEKAYTEAAGEMALIAIKHKAGTRLDAAEGLRRQKSLELDGLYNLKRSALIAANGGEIEITVRGCLPNTGYCGDLMTINQRVRGRPRFNRTPRRRNNKTSKGNVNRNERGNRRCRKLKRRSSRA